MMEWHCFFLANADMQHGFLWTHLSTALQHQTSQEKGHTQTDCWHHLIYCFGLGMAKRTSSNDMYS